MEQFVSSVFSIHHMAAVVRDARLARGWTQEDLAVQSGFSRVWINRFEQTAIAEPSFSRILTMCNVLGIKLVVSYAIDKDAKSHRQLSKEKAKEDESRGVGENIAESIDDNMADKTPSRQSKQAKKASILLEALALRAKEQRASDIDEEERA
jgi:transcriptional regulator with XRE-family HTH domain